MFPVHLFKVISFLLEASVYSGTQPVVPVFLLSELFLQPFDFRFGLSSQLVLLLQQLFLLFLQPVIISQTLF